jgi:4a-hydroxytetrahydrobiopterin dehydratase
MWMQAIDCTNLDEKRIIFMPRPPRLNDSEMNTYLINLPHWSANAERTKIHRQVRCEDYAAALALVCHLSMAAQTIDHHPDIAFGWGYVDVWLTTHDQGGLTEYDFRLAELFNTLLEKK